MITKMSELIKKRKLCINQPRCASATKGKVFLLKQIARLAIWSALNYMLEC